MGLFGGSSKSNANTTAVTGTVANYGSGEAPTLTNAGVHSSTIVNSAGGAPPITVVGNKKAVTINTSDYGAINAARDLSMAALETNGQAFRDAITKVSDNASAIVNKTLGIAEKNQVPESAQMQDTLLKLGLIIAAAVAVVMVFGKVKA